MDLHPRMKNNILLFISEIKSKIMLGFTLFLINDTAFDLVATVFRSSSCKRNEHRRNLVNRVIIKRNSPMLFNTRGAKFLHIQTDRCNPYQPHLCTGLILIDNRTCIRVDCKRRRLVIKPCISLQERRQANIIV
jgi:hypothetical protein